MRRLPDSAIAGVTLVALFCGAWLLHSGTASHAPQKRATRVTPAFLNHLTLPTHTKLEVLEGPPLKKKKKETKKQDV
ncbi:hypothetical protein PV381_43660, partial [Streptomyces scabiei]|nr:hypothetical protein [Streptomyces scabiei]